MLNEKEKEVNLFIQFAELRSKRILPPFSPSPVGKSTGEGT